ncbi:Complement component C7 [Collichthys lucidus]|uniref:Complement component C7 n=1 Tax=Collichthys lucidus TaxID=240159 RepID=A0A4U5UXR8_COLLU|nr:Complement component C7 [Collichthys lucidus]
MFESQWHYAKDIVNRQKVSGTTSGYHNYDLHERDDKSRTHKLLVLKNAIEVAQFQSNSPEYLPISEEFWKALAKLPPVYDYAAYRKVLEMYGTHYLSEGSLGGSFKLRPLSELVKEVQCAGVKKLYLRRAIEQYLSESDPCHCRPCSNNGMVVMDGDECKCICKPGTSGRACERGTEAEGQQDQTNQCQCKDSADCVTPGYNVCVRVGEDAANRTMSECDAGLRRCKGEKVSVVSILPCTD